MTERPQPNAFTRTDKDTNMPDPRETFESDQAAAEEETRTREDRVFDAQLRTTNAHAELEEAEAMRLAMIAGAVLATTQVGKSAFLLLTVRAIYRGLRRRG